jgi:demethoxyubiquinone hydroxylase (CLK1/Coq7/Cat5 family)
VLFEKERSLPVRQETLHREVDDDHEIRSFIVRVWVEKNGDGAQRSIYRGQVVCLPNRERHYIKQLGEIIAIIQNNLDENPAAT